jgi:hypothetical protein
MFLESLTLCLSGLLAVSAVGCSAPNSDRPNPSEGKHFVKYYLVHHREDGNFEMFVIDGPDEVGFVGKWITAHVNESPKVQKARGLVLNLWHNELLRIDDHGNVQSDYLSVGDVISEKDYKKLNALFREYGRHVNTIPGRKPPRVREKVDEPLWIEFESKFTNSEESVGWDVPDALNPCAETLKGVTL